MTVPPGDAADDAPDEDEVLPVPLDPPIEVPEADAIDQARAVPLEDDDRER